MFGVCAIIMTIGLRFSSAIAIEREPMLGVCVCPGQVFSAVSPESKLTIPYTAWGNKIRRVCTLIHCYRVDVVQWERETDSDSAWG